MFVTSIPLRKRFPGEMNDVVDVGEVSEVGDVGDEGGVVDIAEAGEVDMFLCHRSVGMICTVLGVITERTEKSLYLRSERETRKSRGSAE